MVCDCEVSGRYGFSVYVYSALTLAAPTATAWHSGNTDDEAETSGTAAAHQQRTQLGTLARIWSASVLRASPMSYPSASKSITTLALATMARSLLKPATPPRTEF